MLPFLKKNKAPDKKDAPRPEAKSASINEPAARPAAEAFPNTQLLFEGAGSAPGSGILVEEETSALLPEVEEAAILFASGRGGEAATTLSRFLQSHPDVRDTQPWFMLFDLYEASGQREPFEDMAVDFAVRFERSPPTWQAGQALAVPGAGAGKFPIFVFEAGFSVQDKARLQHFMTEAGSAAAVVLDFSKAVVNNPAYAQAILECVETLAKRRKPVKVQGAPAFAVRLNAQRQANKTAVSLWMLYLAVLQLQGKMADFEDVAVDYAVQFEMSPPSYTPPLPLPEDLAGEAAEEAAQGSDSVFTLVGVIDADSQSQFEQLKTFAQGHGHVEIDLARVSRIDFAAVGLLLDTLLNLQMSGCQLSLKNGNELVTALLQVVSVDQFATIVPRVRK